MSDKTRLAEVEAELEEAEDRFEFCDNCERPSREEDLAVEWCRDAESGEQVDARICLVCRAEAKLAVYESAVEEAVLRIVSEADLPPLITALQAAHKAAHLHVKEQSE